MEAFGTVIVLVGVAAVLVGVAMVYTPAAIIFGGVALSYVGYSIVEEVREIEGTDDESSQTPS